MRHLVIAKDYECNIYEILMSGTDKELSEFTKSKKDSLGIRNCFKDKIKKFINKYNDSGDIVIIDDEYDNKRIKVLYKKDMIIFKNVILNQKFVISTFKSWLYKIYTEADIINIKSFKGTSYQHYIKKSFKNKKNNSNYYDIVRKVLTLYDEYSKENNVLSKQDIYNNYLKSKKENLKNLKQTIQQTNKTCLNPFYDLVFNYYQSGGMEEVLSMYSLDDLYLNLNEDELESLGLTKRK